MWSVSIDRGSRETYFGHANFGSIFFYVDLVTSEKSVPCGLVPLGLVLVFFFFKSEIPQKVA